MYCQKRSIEVKRSRRLPLSLAQNMRTLGLCLDNGHPAKLHSTGWSSFERSSSGLEVDQDLAQSDDSHSFISFHLFFSLIRDHKLWLWNWIHCCIIVESMPRWGTFQVPKNWGKDHNMCWLVFIIGDHIGDPKLQIYAPNYFWSTSTNR